MKIIIETILHEEQRYNTLGDWFEDPSTGTIHIRISSLNSWKQEFLIGVHELVEWAICQSRGISQSAVDDFDLEWVPHDNIEEPGEDQAAPYYLEHQFAMGIERLMAAEMNVNWIEYDRVTNDLSK